MAGPGLRPHLVNAAAASRGSILLVESPTECQRGTRKAETRACLLTICDGAHAVFRAALVSRVVTKAGEEPDGAVCIVGAATHVTFEASRFEDHLGQGSALTVGSGARVVLTDGSAVLRGRGTASAMTVDGGAVLGLEDVTVDSNAFGPTASDLVPQVRVCARCRLSFG